MINFMYLILNEKLRSLETQKSTEYGQVYFAELMVQDNLDLYL